MSSTADTPAGEPALSPDEFRALHARLRRETSWGPGDRRGGLNTTTSVTVRAAAGEVRSGRHVSLASLIETRPGPDNPRPSTHAMVSATGADLASEGLDFVLDRIAMNVHGDDHTHLDALSHVVYDGTMYAGVPEETVTEGGASALTVDVARDGVVGRGVLLDVPRVRGVPWLEPGDAVTLADVAAAEAAQGVRVGEGDLLLVRVGHARRRSELGPWDVAHTRAGLHPQAVPFLAERRVALLGSDSNNDVAPSLVRGVGFPVHVLAIHAMGLMLLDYLQLEELAALCAQEGRWSFLCVVAPLRLPAATGSPVNPIAVL